MCRCEYKHVQNVSKELIECYYYTDAVTDCNCLFLLFMNMVCELGQWCKLPLFASVANASSSHCLRTLVKIVYFLNVM